MTHLELKSINADFSINATFDFDRGILHPRLQIYENNKVIETWDNDEYLDHVYEFLLGKTISEELSNRFTVKQLDDLYELFDTYHSFVEKIN